MIRPQSYRLNKGILLSVLFLAGTVLTSTTSAALSDEQDIVSVLDANKDNFLDPYEALDVLLTIEKELGRTPTGKDLASYAEDLANQQVSDFISAFDKNDDGRISVLEGGEEIDFLRAMDGNRDGFVSTNELAKFDFEASQLASLEEIQERLDEIFDEKDTNRNGAIDLDSEVSSNEYGRYAEQDLNRDGKSTRDEIFTFMKADNIPVSFRVENKTAYMTGVITSALPATILRLLHEHPEVNTIEMVIVPGSINDEANLRAAMYIQNHGLATKVSKFSSIASGGTDFFMAGVRRIVEAGALLGVHSWGGGAIPATDVPRDDPVHQKYLDFYEAVGIPADFYWYTLEAAPAEDMHIMTEQEIESYKVRKN